MGAFLRPLYLVSTDIDVYIDILCILAVAPLGSNPAKTFCVLSNELLDPDKQK